MAGKRSAVYSVKVDSGSAVKDVKNLDKSFKTLNKTATTTKKTLSDTSGINKFEQELQELDALIDSGTLDVRQMTKVIQDYQTVAFKAGAQSPVGSKAIDKASALKDRITDLNNRVKQGSSDYAKMDGAIQGASGAMAGFQAFQGVSALMGQDNEELVKTIMKLQASMSILNSIQVLRNTLNKDSSFMMQVQAIQMRIRTKETYAQITAQKMANTVLGEGTKASKLFSKALVATGIGALVVGIGLLVANWDKLKVALGGATREQELSNEVTDKAIEASAEELSALDKLQGTINDETVSREDKVKAVKKLQDKYPALLSNVDAEKVSIEELNEALEINAELVLLKSKLDAIAEMRTEAMKEQIKAETDAQTQSNKSLNSWVVGLIDEEGARKLHNAEQAVSIKQSKKETDVLDNMSKSIEEQIKLKRKEAGLPETDAPKPPKVKSGKSKAQQERERQQKEVRQAELDAIAFRNEVLEMIAQAEEEAQTSAQQKELNAVNEKYFELISRAEEFGQESQVLKDAQAKAELDIENKYKKQAFDKAEALKQKEQAMILATEKLKIDAMVIGAEKEKETLQMSYDAKRLQFAENELLSAEEKVVLLSQLKEQEEIALNAIEEKWRKKREDDAKKESDAKKKMFTDYTASVSSGLGSLSALNDAVTQTQLNNAKGNAVEEEKIRKKSFERNKKLQIVTAIINGVQAVQSALASPFPLNIGLAVLNGALAIANVAKIASTKYEGGGGGAGAIAPSTSSASPGASASSFSIGDTSASTTALNEDGSQGQEQGQPVQVFVTETDITETQNNVENIEVISTF
jgi:hypothetical protein